MIKYRMIKNEKGFTLIEMLIAAVIGIIVLGGSIYAFTKQDKLIRQQNADTNLRALGRLAMSEFATEIRRAGYGLPPGLGITAADAATLTIQANINDVYAMLAVDANAGNATISVIDITGPSGLAFQDGDPIAIFDVSNPTNSEINAIIGAPTDNAIGTPDVITLTALAAPGGSYLISDGAVVHQYAIVLYSYAGNRITVSTDGGAAIPVIGNVSALSFQYFDTTVSAVTPLTTPVSVANLPTINRIRINMTLQDSLDSNITLSLNSDINIRNNS